MNGKDPLGLSITMPIDNVSLWLWGSHNCYAFNDDEPWAFIKVEYFSDYQLDFDMHIYSLKKLS